MAKAPTGWHGQTIRHSNARKTGKAGGTYSTYSVKEGNFQSNLIKARSEQEAKNKYTAKYGYFGGMRYAKKLKDSDGDGVSTIGALEKDKRLTLVSGDDVRSIKEYLGKDAEDYDGFLVEVKDGDYERVYGFEGSVPDLKKKAYRVK